jgi:translation initiation factor IF-2
VGRLGDGSPPSPRLAGRPGTGRGGRFHRSIYSGVAGPLFPWPTLRFSGAGPHPGILDCADSAARPDTVLLPALRCPGLSGPDAPSSPRRPGHLVGAEPVAGPPRGPVPLATSAVQPALRPAPLLPVPGAGLLFLPLPGRLADGAEPRPDPLAGHGDSGDGTGKAAAPGGGPGRAPALQAPLRPGFPDPLGSAAGMASTIGLRRGGGRLGRVGPGHPRPGPLRGVPGPQPDPAGPAEGGGISGLRPGDAAQPADYPAPGRIPAAVGAPEQRLASGGMPGAGCLGTPAPGRDDIGPDARPSLPAPHCPVYATARPAVAGAAGGSLGHLSALPMSSLHSGLGLSGEFVSSSSRGPPPPGPAGPDSRRRPSRPHSVWGAAERRARVFSYTNTQRYKGLCNHLISPKIMEVGSSVLKPSIKGGIK